MSVFNDYARFYDLLYKDKDYAAEVDYIASLLQCCSGSVKLLELGCGTGIHASLLAQAGHEVHGVDASPDMLNSATERMASLPNEISQRISFELGDVRSYRAKKQFDAVLSLFHVISYQTTVACLRSTFETVKFHLKPGGLFIFDFWYGSTVLSDPPVVRLKELEDEFIKLTRIAVPVIHPNENIVEVNYKIFVTNKATQSIKEIQESHRMRYLFLPEIDILLNDSGMQRIRAEEWMTGNRPSLSTWSVCIVARAF